MRYLLTSQSRKIDEMIQEYEQTIERLRNLKVTERERFYNNGRCDGAIEAYTKVISDLKKLKEM